MMVINQFELVDAAKETEVIPPKKKRSKVIKDDDEEEVEWDQDDLEDNGGDDGSAYEVDHNNHNLHKFEICFKVFCTAEACGHCAVHRAIGGGSSSLWGFLLFQHCDSMGIVSCCQMALKSRASLVRTYDMYFATRMYRNRCECR